MASRFGRDIPNIFRIVPEAEASTTVSSPTMSGESSRSTTAEASTPGLRTNTQNSPITILDSEDEDSCNEQPASKFRKLSNPTETSRLVRPCSEEKLSTSTSSDNMQLVLARGVGNPEPQIEYDTSSDVYSVANEAPPPLPSHSTSRLGSNSSIRHLDWGQIFTNPGWSLANWTEPFREPDSTLRSRPESMSSGTTLRGPDLSSRKRARESDQFPEDRSSDEQHQDDGGFSHISSSSLAHWTPEQVLFRNKRKGLSNNPHQKQDSAPPARSRDSVPSKSKDVAVRSTYGHGALIRFKNRARALGGDIPTDNNNTPGFFDDSTDASAKDRKLLDTAINGLCLQAQNGQYYVKGMLTSLMPHQIIAVNWMVNVMENSGRAPNGGLLFDDMGLGKTMQCIATMCQNPPPRTYTEQNPRITLIVCPPALLQQWKDEITRHTAREKFTVYIHHGTRKIERAEELRKRQIIITTYGAVTNDYPKVEVPSDIPEDERRAYIAHTIARGKGVLHRIKYWRVIFDECHYIRNRDTHKSRAAMNIAQYAKHRWCLSGTPIVNGIEDVYPYFNIINMPGLGESAEKFDRILKASGKPEATVRAALKGVMMRRTKMDTFLGKPLISLPRKDLREVHIDFDSDARTLYDEIEDYARSVINHLSKQGRLRRELRCIFVLFLRLRQLCNHPYITGNGLRDSEWGKSRLGYCIEKCDRNFALNYGLRALHDSTPTATYGRGVHSGANTNMPAMEDAAEDMGTRCIRDYLVRLKRTRKEREDEEIKKEEQEKENVRENRRLQKCLYCDNEVDDPVITKCLHVYCRDCVLEAIRIEATYGGRQYACRACGDAIEKEDLEDTTPFEVENFDDDFGQAAIDFLPDLENKRQASADNDAAFLEDVNERFFMSKKLRVMRDQLIEWRLNKPGQKVVLFTLSTKFLDIIQKVTNDEGWSTCRYDGRMSISLREESLVKFKSDPECWIMLTSITAGGVGLNLTHASLVISMDLWWNAAVETQAFDRVHRIGQVNEVEVVRFVMKNTVETRMLAIQNRKLGLASVALGEDGPKGGKLSHEEFVGLFGSVTKDDRGRISVRKEGS
ncbi:hypothetical protein BJ508DRAFT_161976 [Ascobolus immersus RN42]|uniref:P-loop containing nucleoside triphosphate hydrolase protein n=1 Tax=Ascobolus immersus RN42 TaxID=1160509 RepID=A0A3N4HVN0_ASCIM|nr:hypothetical protein BJ508DRAFT_161976 [Ascobolus immersus RN42]